MNKWRKAAITVLVAGVVLAVIYGMLPGPADVDVAEVTRGPLSVTIKEEGRTRVKDRFVLSSPVAGFLRRIDIEPGDRLKKGVVVARIEAMKPVLLDSRTRANARAAVKAARAALKAAEQNAKAASANAEYAQVELKRIEGLQGPGFASKDDYERARTQARRTGAELQSAGFAVDVARHKLEAALTTLEHFDERGGDKTTAKPLRMVLVKAPLKGTVLKVHKVSEGVVSAGEPLLTIADTRSLEVETDVMSRDAVRIRPGTAVLFSRWGGEDKTATLTGTVRVVEPFAFTKLSTLGVEEQRVMVIADIDSPPEAYSLLGDGYTVDAAFVIWESADALTAPASALFRKGDKWAVFVFDNGKASLRQIEVGHISGLAAQVLSGLKQGDTVITHPDRAIEDGAKVRLREQK